MTVTTLTLEFEQVRTCPGCSSWLLASYKLPFHPVNKISYSRCQECGLIFLNPRLSDAQTAKYYAGMYRDALGVMDIHDMLTQEMRSQRQARLLAPLLEGRKTALEIGSSAGHLMSELLKLGVKSVGIEPDTRYHTNCPAGRFACYKDLADLPKDTRYDLITMSHSLEHINHPFSYMRGLIRERAKPNSLIMVEVPNADQNNNAFLVHHPVAYTPNTLAGLFSRLGFTRVVKIIGYGDTRRQAKNIIAVFSREGA